MFTFVEDAYLGPAMAAVLFVGILVCLRVGRYMGEHAIARAGDGRPPGTGSLETAIFALLGLLIAFTFSGALERFDARRGLVVQEANAIGTAWLRLDLVPVSAQPKLRASFRRYVDSRIETYRKVANLAAAYEEVANSQRLQSEVWSEALAAVRQPDAIPAAAMLLLPALNEVFDIATTRVAATQVHPPGIVYAMLIALALASALLAGYQSAGEREYLSLHKLGFAAIIACTVYVIVDIEHPRLGWVRIDAMDQVLRSVRAGMN